MTDGLREGAPADPHGAPAPSPRDRPPALPASLDPGDADPPSTPGSGGTRRLSVSGVLHRYGLLIAWAVLIAVFGALVPESFLHVQNFKTIFNTQAILLVLTIAVLITLIPGEFDLSFAATFGISEVLLGYLNVRLGIPIAAAIVLVLLIGAAIGAVNAILTVLVGVESIIVTLGSATVLSGVALALTTEPIVGIAPGFVQAVRHATFGLQTVLFVALAVTLAAWYVLTYTPVGRYLYFTGAGRNAARLAGIRVDRLRFFAFMWAGTLSALAGVLLAGVLGSSDASIGPAYLLPGFAAAYLGSAAIVPGRFNVWGSFIAVYFLVTGITGLELLGLSGWISQAFYGGSLLIAVVISHIAGGRRNSRRSAGSTVT
ncbi:MAG: ABC-type transporter, integral rane subunit [Conexibacter sp.]|nr:ABC-type transporter, integral rane subunit [Conexibacter sp.]